MKVLYAIQGTGNGHICRAAEIVPLLRERAETDVLVSGIQSDIDLPFPVKFKLLGLSFIFGKKGGIDLLETYRKSRLKTLRDDIRSLPVEEYDLVISDFEPVSAWACALAGKPCIALSHQAAVISKHSPHPRRYDAIGRAVMKVYAPCALKYGFHFKPYAENIHTPVIRREIRNAKIENKEHYTVYLPAYGIKRIREILSQFPDTQWEVFAKNQKNAEVYDNIRIFPVNTEAFMESMAGSLGVLCGAGFETPAEALFLKKKLLVVPMKNQYEQRCNATALKELGIPVMKSLRKKHLSIMEQWLSNDGVVDIDYPDNTAAVLNNILSLPGSPEWAALAEKTRISYGGGSSAKDLRRLTFGKVLSKLGE